MKSQTKKNLLLAILISLSVGCDSDSDTATNNGDSASSWDNIQVEGPITLVGLIKMEPNSTDADYSRALFGKLDAGLSPEYVESSFAPRVDTCAIEQPSTGEYIPNIKIYDRETTLISAGENVIVNSAGGTYATLSREYVATGPVYRTTTPLTGTAPNGLTVDIIGEEFPGFPTLAINDVPALQISTPAVDQNVDANTEFNWVPNNVQGSVIEIYSSGTGAANETILVSCIVVDDGNFTFPSEIRAAMGEGYDDNWSAYLRVVYNVVRQDNAMVFSANSVERN